MDARRSRKAVDHEAEAMMREDAAKVNPEMLDQIRAKVRERRDLDLDITSTEEQLSEKKKKRYELDMETLPSMFMKARVLGLTLEAEGNLPAYKADLKPYYHANINKDWEPEKQLAAFKLLEKMKLGDLIKTLIELEFGRGDLKVAKKVMAALNKLKVPYSVRQGVPWNSLTAAIRDKHRKGGTLSDEDLATLGATVGNIVKLTPQKQEK